MADYCSKCCASNSGGIGGGEAASVCGTIPSMGAIDVAVDSEISITFAGIPDISTCNASTITFDPALTWDIAEGTVPEEIVIIPTTPMVSNQVYTLLIDGVVTIESLQILPYLLKFTTA